MASPPEQFDIAVEQRKASSSCARRASSTSPRRRCSTRSSATSPREGASTVLDLEAVEFIDSSGLQTILTAHAASQRDGFGLTMLPGPPPVMKVFELAGLDDRLPFAER